MTALTLARRAQVVLAAIAIGRAGMYGITFAMMARLLSVPTEGARAVAGLVVIAFVWRARWVRSLERTALWIEEHDPRLQYAFVTAVDPRYVSLASIQDDLAITRAVDVALMLRRAAGQALLPGILAFVLLGAIRAWWPTRSTASVPTSQAHSGRRTRNDWSNRLVPISARVLPPMYSHLSPRNVAEPVNVSALVGSQIILLGRGDTAQLAGVIGDRRLAFTAMTADRWRAVFAMPAKPSVVHLTDRTHHRLIALDPIPDSAPAVQLEQPARDSVLQTANGTLRLAAVASDDYGLADGSFEIVVTSGEEENGGVSGKAATLGLARLHDARNAQLHDSLSLDSLKLLPGNVLSIRAVVHDNNSVSGPGTGVSDTRTFRVVTSQEYDSAAVDAAPPQAADSAYLSQRMIVLATKRLLQRMRGGAPLRRAILVESSRRLWEKQDHLRIRVEAVLTLREEHDQIVSGQGEAMSVTERGLLERARSSMVDAADSLAIALPAAALPFELQALAKLDSVRALAKRLYLRGQPVLQLVNISRVRMTGTARSEAGARTPGAEADTSRVRLWWRFVRAARSYRKGVINTNAFTDSLIVFNTDASDINAPLVTAFSDAISQLRTARDATAALARVRGILVEHVVVDTTGVAWRAGWDGGVR